MNVQIPKLYSPIKLHKDNKPIGGFINYGYMLQIYFIGYNQFIS